jgi:hypothetical protein
MENRDVYQKRNHHGRRDLGWCTSLASAANTSTNHNVYSGHQNSATNNASTMCTRGTWPPRVCRTDTMMRRATTRSVAAPARNAPSFGDWAQIYEVSKPGEVHLISKIGVDHIGILIGNGELPRELSIRGGSESSGCDFPGVRRALDHFDYRFFGDRRCPTSATGRP